MPSTNWQVEEWECPLGVLKPIERQLQAIFDFQPGNANAYWGTEICGNDLDCFDKIQRGKDDKLGWRLSRYWLKSHFTNRGRSPGNASMTISGDPAYRKISSR